jgi:hypothetical protein
MYSGGPVERPIKTLQRPETRLPASRALSAQSVEPANNPNAKDYLHEKRSLSHSPNMLFRSRDSWRLSLARHLICHTSATNQMLDVRPISRLPIVSVDKPLRRRTNPRLSSVRSSLNMQTVKVHPKCEESGFG